MIGYPNKQTSRDYNIIYRYIDREIFSVLSCSSVEFLSHPFPPPPPNNFLIHSKLRLESLEINIQINGISMEIFVCMFNRS